MASQSLRGDAPAQRSGAHSTLSLRLPEAGERRLKVDAGAVLAPSSTTTPAAKPAAPAPKRTTTSPKRTPRASAPRRTADRVAADGSNASTRRTSTPAKTTTPATTTPATTLSAAPATTGAAGVASSPQPVTTPAATPQPVARLATLRLADLRVDPADDSSDGMLTLRLAVDGDDTLPDTLTVRVAVPPVKPGTALRIGLRLLHDDATPGPTLRVRVRLVDVAPQSPATATPAIAGGDDGMTNGIVVVAPLDTPTTQVPAVAADPAPPVDANEAVDVQIPVADDTVTPDQSVALPTDDPEAPPVTVTVGAGTTGEAAPADTP